MSDSCCFYLRIECAGRSWVIIRLEEKEDNHFCFTYLRAITQKNWMQDGLAAVPTQAEATRYLRRMSKNK